MWWKWIVQAVMYLSKDPKVQAWARLQALNAINRLRRKNETLVASLYDAAKLDPAPKPKAGRLIRTERDILKPGQVAIVEGRSFRIVRLLSSNARETVYEAVEA